MTGRVEDALTRIPPDEIGDPSAFRSALTVLLRETEKAARKLDADPEAPLSEAESLAFEAVIRADGTRPSLLVRDDAVDPNHPLARDWSGTLVETQDVLRQRMRAIGRIEPAMATARSYFGTGWVVDAAAGLVLTNLHVLEAMWRRHADRMQRTDTGFRIQGDTVFIDFAVESGRVRTNRFRVVEAMPSGVDGAGYARLDAAVLRIEPTAGGEQNVPAAIPVVADTDGPLGNIASFCTVGYPGAPEFTGGMHGGVDWTWVNATLFGGRYGVKRLAPGIVHQPLGSIVGDDRPWVLGHDATTLGGSSGSPILTWLDGDPGRVRAALRGRDDTYQRRARGRVVRRTAAVHRGAGSEPGMTSEKDQRCRIRSSTGPGTRGTATTHSSPTARWSTRSRDSCCGRTRAARAGRIAAALQDRGVLVP